MHENEIGKLILNAAFSVHTDLGTGLLESTYETCLASELIQQGLSVEIQVPMPLVYKGKLLPCGYRMDLCVNNKVIVEVKSVEQLHPVHMAQVLTYLKLSQCKLGYLFNFNVCKLKDGIKRVVLNLEEWTLRFMANLAFMAV